MSDKTWCQVGDLMLTIVNGLFLHREYANDSTVQFKMLRANADLSVNFDEKNLNKHAKYVAWYNKFGKSLQQLLGDLGVKLDFVELSTAVQQKVMPAAPVSPQAQKGVDQAAVNTYLTKDYAVEQLRDIFTKLEAKYPTDAVLNVDALQVKIEKELGYALNDFKEKNVAGKTDDALRILRVAYYFTKVHNFSLKNFATSPSYESKKKAIQIQLQNYLATPLGNGQYVVDVIRDFESGLQLQAPTPTMPTEVAQQTPEQNWSQRRQAAQQRMQDRKMARQQQQQVQPAIPSAK